MTLQLYAISQSTTKKQVKQKLKKMPSNLNDSYASSLGRVNQQPDDFRTLAYRILLWLSRARRPLSRQELSQAVAVEIGDVCLDEDNIPEEEIMTRVCMGLVVVDSDTSIICLVHFSMQEYLQTYFESSSEARLILEEKDVIDMIVKTCLTILLFDEFSKEECKSDIEFELRMQEYPIFFYAALN